MFRLGLCPELAVFIFTVMVGLFTNLYFVQSTQYPPYGNGMGATGGRGSSKVVRCVAVQWVLLLIKEMPEG